MHIIWHKKKLNSFLHYRYYYQDGETHRTITVHWIDIYARTLQHFKLNFWKVTRLWKVCVQKITSAVFLYAKFCTNVIKFNCRIARILVCVSLLCAHVMQFLPYDNNAFPCLVLFYTFFFVNIGRLFVCALSIVNTYGWFHATVYRNHKTAGRLLNLYTLY